MSMHDIRVHVYSSRTEKEEEKETRCQLDAAREKGKKM